MIYLPPLRRFLLPALILLAIIVFYRSRLLVPVSFQFLVVHPPSPLEEGVRIPIADLVSHFPATDVLNNHLLPPQKYFYSYNQVKRPLNNSSSPSTKPSLETNLEILHKCPRKSNPYTNHIRLPNIVQNVSHVPPNSTTQESRVFWNPTIISLPYWSKNQYLVVSRIVTDGQHQENVICEANICYAGEAKNAKPGEMPCTSDDFQHLGPAGGMRCVSAPVSLGVPPTPAESCQGRFAPYADIPGFHDPRIFWSGKGEPLMMVNTQYVLPFCVSPSRLLNEEITDPATHALASG